MELISGSELEAFLFDSVFEDYAAELRFFAFQICPGDGVSAQQNDRPFRPEGLKFDGWSMPLFESH